MISSLSVKNILLVEDNPSYQDLMIEAFDEKKIIHNLHIVNNGEQALSFLRQQHYYTGVPRPDLILLDLNLPGMHGHEFLKIIKRDLELKLIPVIVFTTSTEPKDVIQSYNLKANCYVTKPCELEEFFAVVDTSLNFWLHCSKLPG
jgi:CheY-like chemotaxis protein